jgi:hypothetical protein
VLHTLRSNGGTDSNLLSLSNQPPEIEVDIPSHCEDVPDYIPFPRIRQDILIKRVESIDMGFSRSPQGAKAAERLRMF